MDVLEDLRLLVELQDVDKKIYKIEKKKGELPVLVARAGEALRAEEAETRAAQAELDAANKEKKDAEAELQKEGEHLVKLKLRSTEIKTNKEYFAHLKEIEDCEKKISDIEEKSLLLMEKVEKAEAGVAAKKEILATEQEKFEREKAEIEISLSGGDEELKALKEKREGIVPKISGTVLVHYQSMSQRYSGNAVVEAAGGCCTGCRMMLPPQQFNNVRKGETVIMCNNCRRILYSKEVL